MQLRTYHADTVADALDAIKRDLGADALILQTRSFRRGGILGIGARTVIEITATVAPPRTAPADPLAPNGAARSARTKASPASAPNGAASRSSVDPSAGTAMRAYRQAASPPIVDASSSLVVDRERTRRLAMAMLEQQERASGRTVATPAAFSPSARTAAPPVAPVVPARPQPAAASVPATGPSVESAVGRAAGPSTGPAALRGAPHEASHATGPATATARRYLLVEPDQPASPPPPAESALATPSMRRELAAIRELVEQVLVRQPGPGGNGSEAKNGSPARTDSPSGILPDGGTSPIRPEALQEMYGRLVAQDLASELASEIVAKVERELPVESLADHDAVRQAVLRHLEELIPVADAPLPPAPPDGRPITIALIGPTGVGKTTTLAKLAAAFKLRHGLRVGLVTCDTYRIAAVEQLRTYASIIGVPLYVAMTPEDMRNACAKLKDCDAVLIDTAGRSQNDTARIRDLRAFLDAAQPHEVHLVLSCTAGEKVLVREAEAFGVVGADKVVLTKLDEAVSFGMLVTTVRQVGKSISFLTTGQEVPDQIEVGRSRRLAELVLDGADSRDGDSRDGGPARP
ncbi:MAG: flagellar biosynthesis protein FlhF [Phycisphaerales bacterium]|nr:flagellar biosynthesis protein FlhF [Phycisphaerales bacterium]